ncbi:MULTISPECIES: sel1 repeat family protein [Rhodanobacter]|uniref:Sel1 domain-containing protein repeat-containing protein n=2 Tax=Rhodanobacter TaxID=75309 RepID=I4VV31_9GAMM|nr:sel1 repeat family protein [Rhodanobacter spathiphylli]EIL91072.1 Sel1 domain-containing protein repeat-containing protein [Rhodanobacter spathiphylli B39]
MKFRLQFASLLLSASVGCTLAATGTPVVDQDMRDTLRAMSDASTWGHPDQFGQYAGMQRYAKGEYADALKYFLIGAKYADKLSQLSIGLMYLHGDGVATNLILAYAWTAVSAERGYPQFVATRDRIWASLTPSQQVEAIRAQTIITAEYGDSVAKPRMTRELNYWRTQMTGSHIGFDSGVQHVDKAMLSGGVPSANCARRTLGNVPIAGCGGDVYARWRWDPKTYYSVVDSNWKGKVTVGDVQPVTVPPTRNAVRTPADGHIDGK